MSTETNTENTQVAVYQTGKDAMNAVFIVSVLLNLAIFIAWLTISADPNAGLYLVSK